MLLAAAITAAPPVWTNVVDVRDAADLHVRAMSHDEGNRGGKVNGYRPGLAVGPHRSPHAPRAARGDLPVGLKRAS